MTSEASEQQNVESEAVALDVWLQFLSRADGDDDGAFENLCSQRSDIAFQLRQLRSKWQEDKIHLPETTDSAFQERLRSLANPLPRGARFRREGEIARGGMGVIHKVRDLELDRSLALKEMIVGSAERHPVAASRFLEEAQITAQLDHPGIVPVHEVGMDAEGRIYFAMKLVRGRDLKAILELVHAERENWNQTRALSVLLKVCEAMAYAHSKGVIHRDLKPANIMVGNFGEVYVMDWGLARALGRQDLHDMRIKEAGDSSIQTDRRAEREDTPDSPLVTMDGAVLGTPSYMAPEQGRGEVQIFSPRADVYSVGAILYHLVTGRAPFVHPQSKICNHTILARLLDGPPQAIQELVPRAPAELVAICERAMARDASARYPDMGALAGDLEAFMEQRVVKAYKTGAWIEGKKWMRRNRALAAAVLAVVTSSILGLSAFVYSQCRGRVAETRERIRANAKAGEAEQNLRLAQDNAALATKRELEAKERAVEADAARQEAERNAARAGVFSVATALFAGDAKRGWQVLERIPDELRRWEWNYMAGQLDTSETVLRHSDNTECAVFSPSCDLIASGAYDGAVSLWDVEREDLLWSVGGHYGGVKSLSFDPHQEYVASAGVDGLVRLWLCEDETEGEDRTELFTLDPRIGPLRRVDVSDDGLHLAAVGERGIVVYTTSSWEELHRQDFTGQVSACVLRPRTTQFSYSSHDNLWLRDVKALEQASSSSLGGATRSVDAAPHRRRWLRLAATIRVESERSEGAVQMWVRVDGKGSVLENRELRDMQAGQWRQEGIDVWVDSESKKIDFGFELTGDPRLGVDRVELIDVGSAERPAASGSVQSAFETDIADWTPLQDTRIELESDAAASEGCYMRMSRGPADRLVGALGADVADVCFDREGSALASGLANGKLKVWHLDSSFPGDVMTGLEIAAHSTSVRTVALSADGQWLASGAADGPVRLWNASTGAPVALLLGSSSSVRDLDFSADGQRLMAVTAEGALRIWRTAEFTGMRVAGSYPLMTAEVNATGTVIASLFKLSGYRGDAEVGVVISRASQGGGFVELAPAEAASDFDVDEAGRRIVTVTTSRQLDRGTSWRCTVWDVEACVPLRSISLEDDRVTHRCAIADDGRSVAFTATGRSVQVIDVDTGEVRIKAPFKEPIMALALTPDGQRVAVGDKDGMVRLISVRDGSLLDEFRAHEQVLWIGLTDSGLMTTLGLEGGETETRLWSSPGNEIVLRSPYKGITLIPPAFVDEKHRLAIHGKEQILLYDVESGELVLNLPLLNGRELAGIGAVEGGRVLRTVGKDGSVVDFSAARRSDSMSLRARLEPIVSRLFDELFVFTDVKDRLVSDATLSPAEKDEAIRIARDQGPSLSALTRQSRDLAQRGSSPEDAERALKIVEGILRQDPNMLSSLHIRGMAQYRLGLYHEARASMLASMSGTGGLYLEIERAVLAMALQRLGRAGEAREYMRDLRKTMSNPGYLPDPQVLELFREAEEVLSESKASEPK